MMNEIEPELLCRLLNYEPETGKLYWLPRPESMFPSVRIARSWNSRYAGAEALTADNGLGYRIGSVFNRHYLAHRVAWALSYGAWPEVIDHINGDPRDNRLSNLRSVSHEGNARNARLRSDNTSGRVGVSLHSDGRHWVAQIAKEGDRVVYLGIYHSKEGAIAARESAEKQHGYHPNHGRAA